MFMTTGSINIGHTLKGVVEATSSLMLSSDDIDKFNLFDQLFDEAKQKLERKASVLEANGIIGLSFNTEVVELNGAPRFLVAHAFGTAVKVDD